MNGISGDAAVKRITDPEQVHANGNYCHCGDACVKEGKPPSPPQKTPPKQRQRISRNGQTLSLIAQNQHMLCAEVPGQFGRTSFYTCLNIWKGRLRLKFTPGVSCSIWTSRKCSTTVLRGKSNHLYYFEITRRH